MLYKQKVRRYPLGDGSKNGGKGGGDKDHPGSGKFNVADYATLEPSAIQWVQWFRTHCPSMRVALYRKHAQALVDRNIGSTTRLKSCLEDEPDVLQRKIGLDKFDAEEVLKGLKDESRTLKEIRKGRYDSNISKSRTAGADGNSSSGGGRFLPTREAKERDDDGGAASKRSAERKASLLQLVNQSGAHATSGVGRRPQPSMLNPSKLGFFPDNDEDEDDDDD
jgi:hypothetical protein